ncbi:MAG: sugar ABC transporter substrate-binding protein [Thermomicrobiales bacterium]
MVFRNSDEILGRRADRRRIVKVATGAAAAFCATGVLGKSYQRALAQDSVKDQILKIPGANKQPSDSDMEKVGELCLKTQNKDKFKGQTVTFIGLNNTGFHNNIFRPLSKPWEEATGAKISWIDVPQAEVFSKVQQGVASGTVEFDVLEGGAPWEGDILGKGLALEMPDSVKQQIEIDDYVKYLQPPVGTWDGKTYRVSIDGDAHNLNYRADVFSDKDLADQWKNSGGEGDWGVPTTWQQVQAYTKFLKGTKTNGLDNYGIIDVCKTGGGFSWYFFASRATAYVKHPDDKAWLFDAETMKPRINNPGFVRAAQDVIDALPSEPADQLNADLLKTLGQFLAGTGTICHWWGDIGSNVYTNSQSVFIGNDKLKAGFSILPGSPDVFNSKTGKWDTIQGNNFAPNDAYLGWGLYVMNESTKRGVSDAAWDLAAHLGGKDLSLWMACYPSGFQPYRTSHFDVKDWVATGYPEDFATAYLKSESDSYNHPNAAIEPRIPGIFQYYVAAEEELAKAFAGEKSAQDALDTVAGQWEQTTDQLGRDNQIKLYQAALGL